MLLKAPVARKVRQCAVTVEVRVAIFHGHFGVNLFALFVVAQENLLQNE